MAAPPRLFRTVGVVLRRRDFDEADRLITVLTRDRGKLRLLAKGARKISSRKAAHVDLFRQVDLLVHQGRTFGVVSQAETVHPFAGLAEDLERLAAAHYLADLTDTFVGEGDTAAGVYDLLVEALQWLESGCDPKLAQRYFELHLLDLEGYRPELYRCPGCGEWLEEQVNLFDFAEGSMVCPNCAEGRGQGRRVSVGAQKVLRFLQRSAVTDCGLLRLSDGLHTEIEGLLGDYIRSVVEWPPRSRRFIETVQRLPEQ
ncbi:MAG: DNA repair protein RecO [Anaerolineae bacterium]|nr:DNA repair protein RecO [Anaerolineae bacterium]